MAGPSVAAAPRAGFGRLVAQTLRLAVPLYLTSLAISVIGTLVGLIALMLAAGGRTWLGELAGPNHLNVLIELGVSAVVAPPEDWGTVAVVVLALTMLPLLMLLFQWLAYTFFAGGILEHLRPNPGETSVPPAFWACCRRWFWPFVRLGAFGIVLLVLTATVSIALGMLIGQFAGMTVGAVLSMALLALVFGWLEIARAAMVWHEYRAARRALVRAVRITLQPIALVLWLFLALPWLGLIVVTASPPSGDTVLSVLAALAIGQVCAFLGAWLKVIRLAAASRLVAAQRFPHR